MTTGEKLRNWRNREGLSQDQAAKKVGTTQRTWGAWEDGSTPEADFIESIEKLTGGAVAFRDRARSRRKKRREDAATESATDVTRVPARAS